MKKYLLVLFCVVSTYAHAFSSGVRPPAGRYDLFGCNNSSGIVHYEGEVIIASQGSNYRLDWKIGSKRQTGIGILCDDILSVAYYDQYNGSMGVVSFIVNQDGSLQGKWAALGSYNFGTELLIKRR